MQNLSVYSVPEINYQTARLIHHDHGTQISYSVPWLTFDNNQVSKLPLFNGAQFVIYPPCSMVVAPALAAVITCSEVCPAWTASHKFFAAAAD